MTMTETLEAERATSATKIKKVGVAGCGLMGAGIRVEADFRNEKLGLKVREAQLQKIPYMLIIGDRESSDGGVTPRLRNGKNLSFMSQHEIIDLIHEECKQRR